MRRSEDIQDASACNFIEKETLAQVFSCEFCEISKNTFFREHLRWLLLELGLTSEAAKNLLFIKYRENASTPGLLAWYKQLYWNNNP